MSDTLSNRTNDFNYLLAGWTAYYKEHSKALIKFLRSEGYSDIKIGKILGISAQAVGQAYPRKENRG